MYPFFVQTHLQAFSFFISIQKKSNRIISLESSCIKLVFFSFHHYRVSEKHKFDTIQFWINAFFDTYIFSFWPVTFWVKFHSFHFISFFDLSVSNAFYFEDFFVLAFFILFLYFSLIFSLNFFNAWYSIYIRTFETDSLLNRKNFIAGGIRTRRRLKQPNLKSDVWRVRLFCPPTPID